MKKEVISINQLRNARCFKKLNRTERIAYSYLVSQKIEINHFLMLRQGGYPDFIAKDKKRYEVKRTYTNQGYKYIQFKKSQIDEFKDDDNILIYYPFEHEPRNVIKFGKIKNLIDKNGHITIIKMNGQIEKNG